MNSFPTVDPIPLPAPVWLFKGLHIVTLCLHFITVEMMLGSLLVAVVLSFLGAGALPNTPAALRLNAAGALARRLPVLMTYVINLGVPPLLFAQVLYGRAIYTSSILIGVPWISVIVLLTVGYWLLYRFSSAIDEGRRAWWLGLLSWLIAASIAKIYSSNMTLMLRPEVWKQMYAASAVGWNLPTGDPTLMPRWLFMMCGGFVFAGLWMIWLSTSRSQDTAVQTYLSRAGGRLALVSVVVLGGIACWLVQSQPEAVQAGLGQKLGYQLAAYGWAASMGLVLLLGARAALSKQTCVWCSWGALAAGFLAALGWTIYRDGIRDLTLVQKNYDVWSRALEINWSVVGLFLALFVAGVGLLAWLISVVTRARPVTERVVS